MFWKVWCCRFTKDANIWLKKRYRNKVNWCGRYYDYDDDATETILYSSRDSKYCSPTFVLLQACTEMVMPICSDGIHDMFEPAPWNYTRYAAKCQDNWGVTPRPNWIKEEYGGKNIATASNIIFR